LCPAPWFLSKNRFDKSLRRSPRDGEEPGRKGRDRVSHPYISKARVRCFQE
jgi:hypothetical protein